MPIAVGIAFKRVARSYWFDPAGYELKEWDKVIVETTRGQELGTVRIPPREVSEGDLQAPLKPILRPASPEDLEQHKENLYMAKEAIGICKQKIARHGLPMKLVHSEYAFDRSQLTFYFVAENRVDFRELVRDLAATFRTRILLMQIGPRDQAKMMGGIGPCGLTLCCSTFLKEFTPISMKMAKDQSLFLNPVKFSGVCGKLMCCLQYEHDMYKETRTRLPRIGEMVVTPRGEGRVNDLNILKEEVMVEFPGGAIATYPASQLQWEKQVTGCACAAGGASEMAEEEVLVDEEVPDTDAYL
ncbi:MAG: stage 0 sporulation family protein [Armatimonadota bacterium]|nr:stage 0 sporulation family protein [bacterium]MDW8320307.1 stage 0 sporulation family protein [Armatimonadota bacterium]